MPVVRIFLMTERTLTKRKYETKASSKRPETEPIQDEQLIDEPLSDSWLNWSGAIAVRFDEEDY